MSGNAGATVPEIAALTGHSETTIHELRYTAGTRLQELGLGDSTIGAILRHRTAEMVRKYSEQKRRARLAIATLDRGTEKERNH